MILVRLFLLLLKPVITKAIVLSSVASKAARAPYTLPSQRDNFVFINQQTEDECKFHQKKPPAVAAARDGHVISMGARPFS